MRIVFVLLSLMMLTSVEGAELLIPRPLVHLVRRADLPRVCNTEVRVEGCTAFAGQVLTCACERAGDGWGIAARAQFIPVLYLLGPDHVAHERDHIGDIESSLRQFLRALEGERFESLTLCQSFAQSEQRSFVATMDGFKIDSNVRRHGSQPGHDAVGKLRQRLAHRIDDGRALQ